MKQLSCLSPGKFEYVINRMQDISIDPISFITSRIQFNRVAEQFITLTSDPDNIKTIIEFT
jgi:hypothetical protein